MIPVCYFYLAADAVAQLANMLPIMTTSPCYDRAPRVSPGEARVPTPDEVFVSNPPFATVVAYYKAVCRRHPPPVAATGGAAGFTCALVDEVMGASEWTVCSRMSAGVLATWAYAMALVREGLRHSQRGVDAFANAEGAFLRAGAVFFLLSRMVPSEGAADYHWRNPIFLKSYVAVGMKHFCMALANAMRGNTELKNRAAVQRYSSSDAVTHFKTAASEAAKGFRMLANAHGADVPPRRLIEVMYTIEKFIATHAECQRAVYLCISDKTAEYNAIQFMRYAGDYPFMAHVRDDLVAVYTARTRLSRQNMSTGILATAARSLKTSITSDYALPPYTGKPAPITPYPWYATLRGAAAPLRPPAGQQ